MRLSAFVETNSTYPSTDGQGGAHDWGAAPDQPVRPFQVAASADAWRLATQERDESNCMMEKTG